MASQQQDFERLVSRYPQDVKHCMRRYHRDELVQGFKGKSCSFEFKPYEEMGPTWQQRFDRLKADLLQYGMKHPLVTYKGHILMGMRRFAVLKDVQEHYDCIEILEAVENFMGPDIVRLNNFNLEVNGSDHSRF